MCQVNPSRITGESSVVRVPRERQGKHMSDNVKQLLKLLLGAGLVLVDSGNRDKAAKRVRREADDLRERVEDWTETARDKVDDWRGTARDKYETAVDRLERAADAIQGRENWAAKAGTFLLGVGIGVGVGILVAPASGQETRDNIAEGAEKLRDRMSERASNIRTRVSEQATNIRDRVSEQAGNLKDRIRDTVKSEPAPATTQGTAERAPRPA
jgi:gas vesicle protein